MLAACSTDPLGLTLPEILRVQPDPARSVPAAQGADLRSGRRVPDVEKHRCWPAS